MKLPMLKSVFMFVTGVFCVWFFPAAKAAVFGKYGFIVSLLAGFLVAIPISLLAGIGAFLVALIMRPTSEAAVWQSLLAGLIAGVIIQVITAAPNTSSGLWHSITQLLSGIPTLLLVVLVGSSVGFVMFTVTKNSNV